MTPHRIAPTVAAAVALVSALVGTAGWADPPLRTHVGTASCAGSSCHGATASWQRMSGSRVASDEYRTWQRHDRHARAFDALRGATGQRIASNLGLADATEAVECLTCHTDYAEPADRGPMYSHSTGVGCEACHGPSMGYLSTHPRGRPHADNVAAGLVELDDPVVRARVCVGCHLGDADRFVSHRLMGAGHPRLKFELDTYGVVMPAHHVVDDDYVARGKRVVPAANLWAVGQAIAVERQMDLLLTRLGSGAFPELTFYDCHACHHPMETPRWRARPSTALGPGEARLQDANLLVLGVIADRIDPALARTLRDDTRRLHDAMAHDRAAVGAPAGRLRDSATILAARLSAATLDIETVVAMNQGLVQQAQAGEILDYAAAEQVTMGLAALAATLEDAGHLPPEQAPLIERALEGCYAAVEDPAQWDPDLFRARVAALP